MKYFLLVFSIFTQFIAFGQHTINGTIAGLQNQDVYLLQITGDNRKIVDTANTDLTGSFEMTLHENFPIGLYAVVAGPKQMIELVYNNEDIRFVTSGKNPESNVQVVESVENLVYYNYLTVKGMDLYKLDLLDPVIENYPKDDDFYQITLNKVKELQQEITDRANQLTEENPNLLVSHFIKVDQPVFADPEASSDQQKLYLKKHYFDNTDFTDTLLMHSNILTSKIVAYLGLYQEKGMTQEQMEDQLLVAVDTVLEKAFVDQQMYEYVMNFLLKGFDAIGFERGLEYLADHSMLSELCVNSDRKAELENKLELIKRLAIGQPAPGFEAKDVVNGNPVKLSDIKADRTVLVFWASWCPHCDDMLPKLKAMYDQMDHNKVKIVGISIDESKDDLMAAIKTRGYNWINIGELKGWDGPIVEEYGISATPTMFVLDANKTIIGKPLELDELKMLLN